MSEWTKTLLIEGHNKGMRREDIFSQLQRLYGVTEEEFFTAEDELVREGWFS